MIFLFCIEKHTLFVFTVLSMIPMISIYWYIKNYKVTLKGKLSFIACHVLEFSNWFVKITLLLLGATS